MHRLTLIILALLATAGLSLAADIHVNPDGSAAYTNIEDAVDNSEPGDTILLGPGIYTGPGNHDIDIPHDLTIQAESGYLQQDVVIDLDGDEDNPRRAFNAIGVHFDLKLVTIRDGWATSGAAIYAEESVVMLFHCHFHDNIADNNGGVVLACESSSVRFYTCVSSGNLAVDSGGVLYATTDTEVTMVLNTMIANGADEGSAITLNDGSYCEMDRTIIAFGHGGSACHANPGYLDATGCMVYHNTGGDWTDGLAGQLASDNNSCLDPRLCDPMARPGNFRPSASSPCNDDYPGGKPGAMIIDETWPYPVYSV